MTQLVDTMCDGCGGLGRVDVHVDGRYVNSFDCHCVKVVTPIAEMAVVVDESGAWELIGCGPNMVGE